MSSARRALGSSSPLRLIFSRRRLPIPAAVRLNQARNSVHQVHQHPILHRSQQKAVISGARSGSNAPLGDLGRRRLMQMHRPPKTTHNTAQKSTKKHKKSPHPRVRGLSGQSNSAYFESACETATATATEQPTIGLLPMPRKPIISTCAGTEDEPAN